MPNTTTVAGLLDGDNVTSDDLPKTLKNATLPLQPVTNNGVNDEIFPTSQKSVEDAKSVNEEKQSRLITDFYEYVYQEVNASTLSFALKELRHYSAYTISVKACRAGDGDNCSNEVIVHQRTQKIGKFVQAD